MTSTAAITMNTENAHIAFLMGAADELMNKNAKKNGIEKIQVKVINGVVYTYPNLINIKPGFNFRDLKAPKAREKLMSLAENIAENGVLQPILLFKEGNLFYAEDGHRRLAAVDIAINELGADIKLVPIRMAPPNSNDANRILSQINYNSGEQPTTLEMAGILGRLESFGWSPEEIGKKVGKSRSRIIQLLEMNGLPESLKEMIRSSAPEVRATFVMDRFTTNKKDEDKTVRELKFAIETARERGYDRATAKHLPADADPGRGAPSTSRRAMEDVENDARQSQGSTDTAPNSSSDGAPDTAPENNETKASAGPTPERRQITIVPGAPAGNVPMPGGTADNGSSAGTDDPSLSAFKKAAYNFFAALEIHGYNRDGSVPTFEGGSFEAEQQWLTIRDYLKL